MSNSKQANAGESKVSTELLTTITSRTGGQPLMAESYEGVVKHVGDDEVVVLYEQEDDLVEHTYKRYQFLNLELPRKGTRLRVYVLVAQLPPEQEDDLDTTF